MIIRKGVMYLVIAQYAYADYAAGDIISQHRSYEAAERAAKCNSFATIKDVRDAKTEGRQ